MTILSTNRGNPKNMSTYARRRSVSKGRRQVLRDVIHTLEQQRRPIWINVYGDFNALRTAMREYVKDHRAAFGIVDRVFNGVVNGWKSKSSFPPPTKWMNTVAEELKSDLQLIWPDLNAICCLRESKDWNQYLFVVAIDRNRIDIIFSKYGLWEGKRDHCFYHWIAVKKGKDAPHVDDFFLSEEDLGPNPQEGFVLV
jgi:hypothetical protein